MHNIIWLWGVAGMAIGIYLMYMLVSKDGWCCE